MFNLNELNDYCNACGLVAEIDGDAMIATLRFLGGDVFTFVNLV